MIGRMCPLCDAGTYEGCEECGGSGSVALWKPGEFKKGGCWTWLGRREDAREAMERFEMELEARAWPSGERVGR